MLTSAQVQDGIGQIWLDDVVCTGNETDLNNCIHLPYGINDCTHAEDIGVRCGTYKAVKVLLLLLLFLLLLLLLALSLLLVLLLSLLLLLLFSCGCYQY